jgi:hypothetical protein
VSCPPFAACSLMLPLSHPQTTNVIPRVQVMQQQQHQPHFASVGPPRPPPLPPGPQAGPGGLAYSSMPSLTSGLMRMPRGHLFGPYGHAPMAPCPPPPFVAPHQLRKSYRNAARPAHVKATNGAGGTQQQTNKPRNLAPATQGKKRNNSRKKHHHRRASKRACSLLVVVQLVCHSAACGHAFSVVLMFSHNCIASPSLRTARTSESVARVLSTIALQELPSARHQQDSDVVMR